MRRHAQYLLPRTDVPESNHPAPAAAGEQVAVGMKRDHEAVVAIALERRSLAAVCPTSQMRIVLSSRPAARQFGDRGFQAR